MKLIISDIFFIDVVAIPKNNTKIRCPFIFVIKNKGKGEMHKDINPVFNCDPILRKIRHFHWEMPSIFSTDFSQVQKSSTV